MAAGRDPFAASTGEHADGTEQVPSAAAGHAGAEPAADVAEETDESPHGFGEITDDEEDDGTQVAQDLDELTAKAEKADEYLALAQRTQADFENFRKRSARDAALAQERGIAKLAKELLPAIDNLERAMQAVGDGEDSKVILDGLKLVQAEVLSALARVGIEPFSPAGEPFDPQFHEAVAQNQFDGVDPGTVVEVYQQGFKQGETVLRPARVLVAA